jgi:hypothetical protein
MIASYIVALHLAGSPRLHDSAQQDLASCKRDLAIRQRIDPVGWASRFD